LKITEIEIEIEIENEIEIEIEIVENWWNSKLDKMMK
jgi:hypothetical protein